jgi:RNA polymerase sigma-70 factor (ECF subfamily)
VEPSSFETVVAAHHAEIYRYLRRVTARPSDADDLAQETFLRGYRACATLPPDANVRAWLFAIATNLARNHFRGEKRRRTAYAAVSAERAEGHGDGPEAATLLEEARSRLETAVDRLPVKQRMAFTLRKVHELAYEEIARSLGCSAETARAHVFQAFRKIRRALDGHELSRVEVAR